MYQNPYHRKARALVAKCLHLKINGVRDSMILQAYATLAAIADTKCADYQQAYKQVFNNHYRKYDRAVLGIYETDMRACEPYKLSQMELKALHEFFSKLSFRDFLRFAVPGFVGDVDATFKLFNRYFDENTFLFVQHIIQVKMIPIMLAKADAKIHDSDSYEDVLEKLYNVYSTIEHNNSIRITKDIFLKLYRAVNQYSLDSNERKPSLRSTVNEKELAAAISVLRDNLGLSKEQQIDFLYRYFVLNENNPTHLRGYKVYSFTQVKDETEREKLLRGVMKKYAPLYPLECLCATVLSKRPVAGEHVSRTSLSEDLTCANDVTLENGLVYSLFSSAIFDGIEHKSNIAIFFPSPFFVRKWISDAALKKLPVTFVFKDGHIKEIINYHYYQGTYAQRPQGNVRFISYSQWSDQVEEKGNVDFDKALLFACNWDIAEQDKWYQRVKAKVKESVEIFSLLSSYEFEKAMSPFSSELSDSRVLINAVSLIPQGINNSSRPRRKLFLRCRVSPEVVDLDTILPTKVYAFTLNTDLKVQAISKMADKPLEIKQQDLAGLYDSIRDLFNEEMLKRRAAGRSKTAAFSYEFSPDITVWCSKSYPSGNDSRPRLEAYVCHPSSQQKTENGYMDRGKRIEATCKRVTRIPDDGISKWLEEEYPFSVLRPRHNSKELEGKTGGYELKPTIDIRDEIIDAYGPLLEGQDIAIKTLWYLHPNIKDLFSDEEYQLFKQSVETEIGYLRLSEITEEKCENLLIRCFGEENKEQLWNRYKVISAAIDQAIKFGYCRENGLRNAIRDAYVRDRLFAQVRSALTKKHFTLEESFKAYHETVRMIESGRMEYIGVLIRLLTGLESNIVCALKVKDFVEISEYGIFQLRVTCQLTNDGSEYKGFDKLESYRSFPCMSSLAEFLQNHIEKIANLFPDFAEIQNVPIVTTQDSLKKASSRYKPYPPKKLVQLCKEILTSVGIEDHVIEIPTVSGGTKETNLNHYGGDFFRENFRYWALEAAKLELDEVQFILGNRPASTFGRYYCDYLNDASQLMMFVKLQRWDAILSCTEPLIGKVHDRNNCSRIEKEIYLKGRYPLHLHIELTIRREGGTVSVKIRGKFGIKVFTTPMELVD